MAGGGGSGSYFLHDLGDTDFNLKNATDGQVLAYDSVLNKWTARDGEDVYARVHANAAFDYANTIISDTQIDPYARGHSNASFDVANTNSTNITLLQGVDLTQNTNIVNVQNSVDSAFIHANAAFDYANTLTAAEDTYARNHANAAFYTANTKASIGDTLALAIALG